MAGYKCGDINDARYVHCEIVLARRTARRLGIAAAKSGNAFDEHYPNHFANNYYLDGTYAAYIELDLGNKAVTTSADGTHAPEIRLGLEPVTLPVQHLPYFLQERELFGYNPHYTANAVTIGPDDQFYIKGDGCVETTDYQGNLKKLSYAKAMLTMYPNWDGTWGPCKENRVGVDNFNNIYVVVNPTGIGYCLLYSNRLRAKLEHLQTGQLYCRYQDGIPRCF